MAENLAAVAKARNIKYFLISFVDLFGQLMNDLSTCLPEALWRLSWPWQERRQPIVSWPRVGN